VEYDDRAISYYTIMYVTKYKTVERELTIWHTEGTNKRNADTS